MTIQGIDFDIPEEENLRKWDYGFLKEKGKHSVKYIWLDAYERDFKTNMFSRQSHLLECGSRGSVSLDGKRLTDKDEIEKTSALFKMSIFGKL